MPGGFGGSYDTNTTIVENPIGKALFERILRAHKVKKNVVYYGSHRLLASKLQSSNPVPAIFGMATYAMIPLFCL